MSIEPIQTFVPKALVKCEPFGGRTQRFCVETTAPMLPVAHANDQCCTFENLQVARDRRKRDGERCGKLVDRRLAAREPGEYRPARRVGKGRKGFVEVGSTSHLFEPLINIHVN